MIEVYNAVIAVKAKGKYLLLKRSGIETNSSFFEFPAGKIELNEDPLLAALRELKEETGLDFKKSNLLYVGETFRPKIKDEKLVKSFMYLAEFDFFPEIKLSDEHTNFSWKGEQEIENIESLGFESLRCINMINAKSIINSAKEALLNIFKKEFKPSEIGVLIVGSAARQDFLKDWSDIDVVLYFNKKDLVFEDLTKIRNVSKSLNANGSHQYWFKVHTSGDFPHLYQKHLIRNYYNDGFQVYGIDVKEVINSKFNVSDEDIISEGKKLAKNHGFSPRFLYRCFITGTHENDPVFESTHIKKEYIINRHANELRIAKIIDMVLDASYFILFKKNIIPSCDKFNYASRFALEFKCLIPFQLLRFREEEWLNGSNSISGERALYAEKLSFEFFEKVYPLLADTER